MTHSKIIIGNILGKKIKWCIGRNFEKYPNPGSSGTQVQKRLGKLFVTVGKGANTENQFPSNNNFWWVIKGNISNGKVVSYKEFKNEFDARTYAESL